MTVFYSFADNNINVLIVENNLNTFFDETSLLLQLFNRYFANKTITDTQEIKHYIEKDNTISKRKYLKNIASDLKSENDSDYIKNINNLKELDNASLLEYDLPEKLEMKVVASSYKFSAFDLRALHKNNKILINYILSNEICDYLLIPSSTLLENNLIRAKLTMYDSISEEFVVIYDEIINITEFENYLKNNILKLFSYFLSEGMGIVSFPNKEYGYDVFLDSKKISDNSIISEGKKSFLITSSGYQEKIISIDVKRNEINNIEFDLDEKVNEKIFFFSDGHFYKAFSSEKGAFDLPYFVMEYKTPQSISFSYPNYTTKYISLIDKIDRIDITLKPSYLNESSYINRETKNFYNSIIFTLSLFTFDVLSRSFLQANPESLFWNVAQKTASYAGYFSISLAVINLIDYFNSMVYAFE